MKLGLAERLHAGAHELTAIARELRDAVTPARQRAIASALETRATLINAEAEFLVLESRTESRAATAPDAAYRSPSEGQNASAR